MASGEDSPDPSIYGNNDRINPVGATRALLVFVRFQGDTARWYDCAAEGGWPHNDSRALPLWADSLLAPYDEDPPIPYYEGSLSDYFDKMSGTFIETHRHWLWGEVYNLLADSITGVHDSAYVPEGITVEGASDDFTALNYRILRDIDTSRAGFSDTTGSGIDFSEYDNNPRDGYVDMIFMVYQHSLFGDWDGYSELVSKLPVDSTIVTRDSVMVGGTRVPVKIAGGWFGSGVTTSCAINKTQLQRVLAHEYVHNIVRDFQRPPQSTDLQFHLAFESQVGLMDGTGGGNSMSAFERDHLGWLYPTTVSVTRTGDTTLTLTDCVTSRQAIKVPIRGRADEYFLLENRQRNGFYDSDTRYLYGTDSRYQAPNDGCVLNTLRGTGLYITHVDSLGSQNPEYGWRGAAKHKYLDVESAQGLWADPTTQSGAQPDSGYYDLLDWIPEPRTSEWTSDSLQAFGKAGRESFTESSNPNTNAYNQDAQYNAPYYEGRQEDCTGIRIFNISGSEWMSVSISFIDDALSSLDSLTSDRDLSASGTQALGCPAGDIDTLRFRVTVRNACGDVLAGYPGRRLELHLTGNYHGDTLYVGGPGANCYEPGSYTATDSTDSSGQASFKVPWLGGHGPNGWSDIVASFVVDGRAIGETYAIEMRSPDIDGDGRVFRVDWDLFNHVYGGTSEMGDFNYDGHVNGFDMDYIHAHYGHQCHY